MSLPNISQQVEASICRAERVVGFLSLYSFAPSPGGLPSQPPGLVNQERNEMETLQIFTAGEILFFIAAAGLYVWGTR